MDAKKPETAFDFNAAVGGVFQTEGGKEFALRLWFWMAAGLSVVLIVTLPFLLKNYGEFMEYNWLSMQSNLGNRDAPDDSQILASLVKMIPAYCALMLGVWGVVAAGETAFYRKFFHGSEMARQPLRFGRAELRTMLVQLGVWGSVFGAYVLSILAVIIIIAIFSMISHPLAALMTVMSVIAVLGLLLMISIRLAPAAALTVSQNKIYVWAARKITKFRFWNLFLAYLVTYLGGYILYYIIYALSITAIVGDADIIKAMMGFGEENPRAMFEAIAERFKNPLFMLLGILAMVLNAATMAAWLLGVAGVNAYAVRWYNQG